MLCDPLTLPLFNASASMPAMIRAAINRPAALWRRTMSNRAFITYYTKEHEYLSVDGNIGTLGITTYAAEELGDIVFVGLPDVDTTVEKE